MSSILIIEDEANIRQFVRANLHIRGYHIIEAETGEQGLALLETADVMAVILDFRLPGMNGNEVLHAMHEDYGMGHIPVILLSASANPVDGEYTNLVARLSKPIDASDLIHAVQQVAGKPA
jgi:two-component system, OmpR family, alkaline phosphatase synthesis response regulator PhoP